MSYVGSIDDTSRFGSFVSLRTGLLLLCKGARTEKGGFATRRDEDVDDR